MKLLKVIKSGALKLFTRNRRFISLYAPGHFYSPIPDVWSLDDRADSIFDSQIQTIAGVNLNREKQLSVLAEVARYYNDLPFAEKPVNGTRYYFDNSIFRYADAITLYSFMRMLQPERVLEVGSGFSSAVMLDTNELFLSNNTRFCFIEPYPERLKSLLKPDDAGSMTMHQQMVQKVDKSVFSDLQKNDILFIDSSHVVKCGSDVNFLVFEVLPLLRPGVYVHFHDVFWPFEYPKAWFKLGRAWNEAYLLRAFLQYNERFEIILFNSYMGHTAKVQLARDMPLFLRDTGGSIWLRVKEL